MGCSKQKQIEQKQKLLFQPLGVHTWPHMSQERLCALGSIDHSINPGQTKTKIDGPDFKRPHGHQVPTVTKEK
jgi:hypothetical protein